MISEEWMHGTKLNPARAKFWGCAFAKSTYIRAHKWYAKYLHVENPTNRLFHKISG